MELTEFAGNNKEGICQYGIAEFPECDFVVEVPIDLRDKDVLKWAGTFVPNIGERVRVSMNGLGAGTVCSYFHEHGYVGVEVQLENAPAWHKIQRPTGRCLVFGTEIKELLEAV